jgi:hypothetical protein
MHNAHTLTGKTLLLHIRMPDYDGLPLPHLHASENNVNILDGQSHN